MGNGWMGKHRKTKKAISVVCLLAFFSNFVLSSAWGVVAGPAGAPFSTRAEGVSRLDVGSFTLPPCLGSIKRSFKGDSGKVVIHIQDAHCNRFAQHKISDIIDHLSREHGTGVVNLEGGSGDYDLSVFTSITAEGVRREVADHFVNTGEVNGAEFYAINNPERVKLWGVEDEELYLAGLKAYRDSLAFKTEVDKYLKQLTRILNNLKRHIYTPELLKIDAARKAYKKGNMELLDYLGLLIKSSKEPEIELEQLANLRLLARVKGMEGGIDFKKADRERNELMDELKKSLSRNEMIELLAMCASFEAKRISQKEFYDFLLGKMRELGLDIGPYGAFSAYVEYVSAYAKVDRSRLSDELDVLDAEIRKALYRNDTQRRLDALSRKVETMADIFSVSLTRRQYRYYLENKVSFRVGDLVEFIEKEAPKYRIDARLDAGITRMDGYLEDMTAFYEYSFRRDNAFLRNLRFSRERGGGEIAVLVTGGFHAENLCDLFEEKNISYVSISPNFTNEKGYECPYFDLLAGRTTEQRRVLSLVIAKAAAMQIASKLSKILGEEVYGKDGMTVFEAAVRVRDMMVQRMWQKNENGEMVRKKVRATLMDGAEELYAEGEGTREEIQVREVLADLGFDELATKEIVVDNGKVTGTGSDASVGEAAARYETVSEKMAGSRDEWVRLSGMYEEAKSELGKTLKERYEYIKLLKYYNHKEVENHPAVVEFDARVADIRNKIKGIREDIEKFEVKKDSELSFGDEFFFIVIEDYDAWLRKRRGGSAEPSIDEKIEMLFRKIRENLGGFILENHRQMPIEGGVVRDLVMLALLSKPDPDDAGRRVFYFDDTGPRFARIAESVNRISGDMAASLEKMQQKLLKKIAGLQKRTPHGPMIARLKKDDVDVKKLKKELSTALEKQFSGLSDLKEDVGKPAGSGSILRMLVSGILAVVMTVFSIFAVAEPVSAGVCGFPVAEFWKGNIRLNCPDITESDHGDPWEGKLHLLSGGSEDIDIQKMIKIFEGSGTHNKKMAAKDLLEWMKSVTLYGKDLMELEGLILKTLLIRKKNGIGYGVHDENTEIQLLSIEIVELFILEHKPDPELAMKVVNENLIWLMKNDHDASVKIRAMEAMYAWAPDLISYEEALSILEMTRDDLLKSWTNGYVMGIFDKNDSVKERAKEIVEEITKKMSGTFEEDKKDETEETDEDVFEEEKTQDTEDTFDIEEIEEWEEEDLELTEEEIANNLEKVVDYLEKGQKSKAKELLRCFDWGILSNEEIKDLLWKTMKGKGLSLEAKKLLARHINISWEIIRDLYVAFEREIGTELDQGHTIYVDDWRYKVLQSLFANPSISVDVLKQLIPKIDSLSVLIGVGVANNPNMTVKLLRKLLEQADQEERKPIFQIIEYKIKKGSKEAGELEAGELLCEILSTDGGDALLKVHTVKTIWNLLDSGITKIGGREFTKAEMKIFAVRSKNCIFTDAAGDVFPLMTSEPFLETMDIIYSGEVFTDDLGKETQKFHEYVSGAFVGKYLGFTDYEFLCAGAWMFAKVVGRYCDENGISLDTLKDPKVLTEITKKLLEGNIKHLRKEWMNDATFVINCSAWFDNEKDTLECQRDVQDVCKKFGVPDDNIVQIGIWEASNAEAQFQKFIDEIKNMPDDGTPVVIWGQFHGIFKENFLSIGGGGVYFDLAEITKAFQHAIEKRGVNPEDIFLMGDWCDSGTDLREMGINMIPFSLATSEPDTVGLVNVLTQCLSYMPTFNNLNLWKMQIYAFIQLGVDFCTIGPEGYEMFMGKYREKRDPEGNLVDPVRISEETKMLVGTVFNEETEKEMPLTDIPQDRGPPGKIHSCIEKVESLLQDTDLSPEARTLFGDILNMFRDNLPGCIFLTRGAKQGFFGMGKGNARILAVDKDLLERNPLSFLHEVMHYVAEIKPATADRIRSLSEEIARVDNDAWFKSHKEKYEKFGQENPKWKKFFNDAMFHYDIRNITRYFFPKTDKKLAALIKLLPFFEGCDESDDVAAALDADLFQGEEGLELLRELEKELAEKGEKRSILHQNIRLHLIKAKIKARAEGGNVSGKDVDKTTLRSWIEEIEEDNDEVRKNNAGDVKEVKERLRACIHDKKGRIREIILRTVHLGEKGKDALVKKFDSRAEEFLSDPDGFFLKFFKWFEARVEGREKYLLGDKSAFAVDIVRRILAAEKETGIGDLLDEYAVHEFLEGFDELSHPDIIRITTELFERGEFASAEDVLGNLKGKLADEDLKMAGPYIKIGYDSSGFVYRGKLREALLNGAGIAGEKADKLVKEAYGDKLGGPGDTALGQVLGAFLDERLGLSESGLADEVLMVRKISHDLGNMLNGVTHFYGDVAASKRSDGRLDDLRTLCEAVSMNADALFASAGYSKMYSEVGDKAAMKGSLDTFKGHAGALIEALGELLKDKNMTLLSGIVAERHPDKDRTRIEDICKGIILVLSTNFDIPGDGHSKPVAEDLGELLRIAVSVEYGPKNMAGCVKWDCAENIRLSKWNEGELFRVFVNILRNGAEAIEEARAAGTMTAEAEVKISARAEGGDRARWQRATDDLQSLMGDEDIAERIEDHFDGLIVEGYHVDAMCQGALVFLKVLDGNMLIAQADFGIAQGKITGLDLSTRADYQGKGIMASLGKHFPECVPEGTVMEANVVNITTCEYATRFGKDISLNELSAKVHANTIIGWLYPEPYFTDFRVERVTWNDGKCVDMKVSLKVGTVPTREYLEREARKAMGAMLPDHRTKISARAEGGDAAVRIYNNGPYMPEDKVIAFNTGKPVSSSKGKEGRGMGLADVRKLVEDNQGEIQVRNEPGEDGRGVTFTIHLPVAAPLAGEEAKALVDEQVKAATEAVRDLRCGVVDWVITPVNEDMASWKASIDSKTGRKLRKDYGLETIMREYAYRGDCGGAVLLHRLESVFEGVLREMMNRKYSGKNPRALAYVPAEKKKYDIAVKALENAYNSSPEFNDQRGRITLIKEENIPANGMVDEVMHVALGKMLLNYERVRKDDYGKGAKFNPEAEKRLKRFLKALVEDPSVIDEDPDIIKHILDGVKALSLRPLDFSEIEDYAEAQYETVVAL